MNRKATKKLREAIAIGENTPFLYTDEELLFMKQQLRTIEEGRREMHALRRKVQGFSK